MFRSDDIVNALDLGILTPAATMRDRKYHKVRGTITPQDLPQPSEVVVSDGKRGSSRAGKESHTLASGRASSTEFDEDEEMPATRRTRARHKMCDRKHDEDEWSIGMPGIYRRRSLTSIISMADLEKCKLRLTLQLSK
jgi:hypothetical protein